MTEPAAGEPIHLLLVDDDDDHALLFERALVRAGRAARLRRARDVATAHRAVEEEAPELVLLDLQLGPEDGCSLLEAWRSREGGAGFPVVVLTTSDERRDRERVATLRPLGYLVKPDDPSAWSALVDTLFRLVRQRLPTGP